MIRLLDIEICKWDDFNPKRDQKSYTWLRLSNDILTDPKLFGLDAEQKLCWIEILCQASKKNEGKLKINPDQIAHVAGVKASKVDELLEHLVAVEIILISDIPRSNNKVVTTLHDRARSQTPEPTTPTNERTNERTNETNDTNGDPGVNAKTLFEIWNANCGTLPKAQRLTDGRKRKATAQLKKYPSLDHWHEAISKLLSSEWCVNEWKPGFDDWMDEDKRLRAVEGKYDRKLKIAPTPAKTREQQVMDHNRSQYERVMKGEL